MKNVLIEGVNMNTVSSKILGQWAECYCEIWKEPPWNEYFWQPKSVVADFQKEMLNPDAVAFLAIHNGFVVGFTHGYSVNCHELQSIAGNNSLDMIFKARERVFYVDELGVTAKYRGNRISIALTTALITAAETNGVMDIVLRTDTKANAARHVYEKLGFVELDVHDAKYPERTYWLLEICHRSFRNLFQFDPTKALFVGVEQECFLTDASGMILPLAPRIIAGLPKRETSTPYPQYGYELSACQLEYKVGPCSFDHLHAHLMRLEGEFGVYEKELGFKRLHSEVGHEDMPLDVYPDPSRRYQEIVKTMPRHVLLAACRVIGTHVHVGMLNHETAMKVYNHVIKKCDWLCFRGNGSFGERLDIYRIVSPDCDPLPYKNWADFYHTACAKGFDKDPRKCWTLIRISKHGTIEFRMFGATSSIKRVVSWAKLCHDLCAEAMV